MARTALNTTPLSTVHELGDMSSQYHTRHQIPTNTARTKDGIKPRKRTPSIKEIWRKSKKRFKHIWTKVPEPLKTILEFYAIVISSILLCLCVAIIGDLSGYRGYEDESEGSEDGIM